MSRLGPARVVPVGRRASLGTNRLVTQRNKRLCRCTIRPTASATLLLSRIALHSSERSRQDSSGEALFVEVWFVVLGLTAFFALGEYSRVLWATMLLGDPESWFT